MALKCDRRWLPVFRCTYEAIILGDPGADSGARESLNRRKNMARRIVKNGEKSPWGQCLTRPVPNCRRRSGFWSVPENLCFSSTNQNPEPRRPFGTGLVRHCPRGLFSPFFTFLRAIFFRLFRISLAPLSAPGSPRMRGYRLDVRFGSLLGCLLIIFLKNHAAFPSKVTINVL